MCKGERPVGAAKGKQTNTTASCQNPPTYTPPSWSERPRCVGCQATSSARPRNRLCAVPPVSRVWPAALVLPNCTPRTLSATRSNRSKPLGQPPPTAF